MTDILPNESGSPMIDSIEQDPLGIETPDSEMNKSISSDDSIELNNSGNSEVIKSESNESPTTTAEIIIKKSPNQKKNYLLKNLKNSQQNSSVQITAPRTELNEQVNCEVANDETNEQSAEELTESTKENREPVAEEEEEEEEATPELVTSITSPSLRNIKKKTSSSGSSAFITKSLCDKMSPGLAKRVSPSDEDSSLIVNSDSDNNQIIYNNGKKLSKSLVTSTCSSSSSTNATITPTSSSTTSSSTTNSFHSASANNSSTVKANSNVKIQNALERNMQKLSLTAGQNNFSKNINSKVNLTAEEMEMFAGNESLLKAPEQYFSGDSLGSTPEHHIYQQNSNNSNQQYQQKPNGEAQEFILNQNNQTYERNAQQKSKLPINNTNNNNQKAFLINHSHRMLERNSIDREMTPDSINNDPQNISETFPVSRKANNHHHHHHPQQQRKKVIVNRSSLNGASHRSQQPHKLVKTRINQTRKPSNLGVVGSNKNNVELTTGQSSGISSSSTSSSTLSSPILNSDNTQPQLNNCQNGKQKSSKPQARQINQTTRIPANNQNNRVNGNNERIVQKVNTLHYNNKNNNHLNRQQALLYNNNNNNNNKNNNKTVHNSSHSKNNNIKKKMSQQPIGKHHYHQESSVINPPSEAVTLSTSSARINKSQTNNLVEYSKAMPVVEEGLSNDELDDNYEDVTNEDEIYDYDDNDQNESNENYIVYECEQDEYENDYYNEDQEDYEETYEDEYEEDELGGDIDQEAYQYDQKISGNQPQNNGFVNQVKNTISSKHKPQNNSINGDVPAPKKVNSNRLINKTDKDYDTDEETNKLLENNLNDADKNSEHQCQMNKDPQIVQEQKSREINVRQIMDPDNQVLIEGVLFRARYLGSTQLVTDGNPTKLTRMLQAQEAVGRIKAPDGESQPCTDVDLFVSTEKIMVLNTDLQEIMMDHSLRSISYIADIGNLVVLMAKRRAIPHTEESSAIKKQVKMICHVFESDEAQIVAQSIGQAFQVAYMEYLKANGIEDMSIMKDLDYQEVLNQQEIMGDELGMFAKKECQKEVIIPKAKNEMLGVVIVESGWGSMLPTVVVANMMPTGPAARCGTLNIGDQIISLNGISMVGLPITACQTQIKNAKNMTLVRLVVVPCPPVVEVLIKRPDTKYQLGFSVQDGIICSLLRGGIAERGGVRVGHRIIEINNQSVVATTHEKIVNILANSVGELRMKTMPTQMFRLLTGQEQPVYI